MRLSLALVTALMTVTAGHAAGRDIPLPPAMGVENFMIAATRVLGDVSKSHQVLSELEAMRPRPYYHVAGSDKVIPLTSILAAATGSKAASSMVSVDLEELKFLPFAQQSIEIFFLLDSMHVLTPERARVVFATAKRMNIKISVVWTGKGPADKAALALAAATGGSVLDLSLRSEAH